MKYKVGDYVKLVQKDKDHSFGTAKPMIKYLEGYIVRHNKYPLGSYSIKLAGIDKTFDYTENEISHVIKAKEPEINELPIYRFMLEQLKLYKEAKLEVGFCRLLQEYNRIFDKWITLEQLTRLIEYKPKFLAADSSNDYWFYGDAWDKRIYILEKCISPNAIRNQCDLDSLQNFINNGIPAKYYDKIPGNHSEEKAETVFELLTKTYFIKEESIDEGEEI